ncbi:uncharacterized protein PG986_011783 [Apiospora aurea]|uniref:GST N-terminal domain-containing protein n=1 Tax=Apiospora aurea TaxID=335848 RepID=A0ABR1PY42_9PEZI
MAATTPVSSSDPIVFYDIASGPPIRPFAPNPWKTRYALNFKRANFVTQWVDLADVTSTRKSLGAEPVRFHPNGEPFYTLPAIKDPSANDTVVADSFDIAVYLDKKYPDAPSLFRNAALPSSSSPIGLYASFNAHMDTIFPLGAALGCEDFPFNPATAAQCQAEFCRRIGAQTWDELVVRGGGADQDAGVVADLDGGGGQVLPVLRGALYWGQGGRLCGYHHWRLADDVQPHGARVGGDADVAWGVWGRLHDALVPYRGTW